jgi:prephenate dehydrogenase
MSDASHKQSIGSIGIIGFGAFGQLIAGHLRPHCPILVFDVVPDVARAEELGVSIASFEAVAECPIVVLAVPVSQMRAVVGDLAVRLRPETLVIDVGSVKVEPAQIMRELLPFDVTIVSTHPLFGPQSARGGILGLRIAICPIRGRRFRVAAFCKKLGLDVIITTPEQHDRDVAEVQGLTHLIASLVVKMNPQPTRMTTRSFELLMSAVEMVRHDAPEVLQAILKANPYAGDVLKRFQSLTSALDWHPTACMDVHIDRTDRMCG